MQPWLDEEIAKLERRIATQRRLGQTLEDGSVLQHMSDRVQYGMELKLFRLRNNREIIQNPVVAESIMRNFDAAS